MPDTATASDRMKAAKVRFNRLMKVMLGASFVVVAIAFGWFYANGMPLSLPLMGAIALAVIGSLMLAAALMGLLFFSAASGADDSQDQRDS